MDNQTLPSSQDAAEPRRDSWDSVNDPEREPTEETEEWEQIIWPLRPMTCTSPPLSSATVQWDVPDPATEMSFFVTDAIVDDEVSGGSSSPALPQDQEESEQDWRIDLQLLNSVLQRTGSDSEVGFRLLFCLFLVASSPLHRHVSERPRGGNRSKNGKRMWSYTQVCLVRPFDLVKLLVRNLK